MEQENLTAFRDALRREERAEGTIEKYVRDVRAFLAFLGNDPLCKETVASWKGALSARGRAPVTINSMLAALNCYLRFIGREDCRVSFLKIQRKVFRDADRELSKGEYQRLIAAASAQGKARLALLMESIGATGIRVSEVKYLTVEAARQGRADISLKGKIRTILIPGKLRRKLLKYAQKQHIPSGEIFLTGRGRSLARRQIWAEMKGLCQAAGVAATKVFPHNLRHLFAVTFYRACKDVARLADVLGHSSINTTRVYLISTGQEHAEQLDRLGLVG